MFFKSDWAYYKGGKDEKIKKIKKIFSTQIAHPKNG